MNTQDTQLQRSVVRVHVIACLLTVGGSAVAPGGTRAMLWTFFTIGTNNISCMTSPILTSNIYLAICRHHPLQGSQPPLISLVLHPPIAALATNQKPFRQFHLIEEEAFQMIAWYHNHKC